MKITNKMVAVVHKKTGRLLDYNHGDGTLWLFDPDEIQLPHLFQETQTPEDILKEIFQGQKTVYVPNGGKLADGRSCGRSFPLSAFVCKTVTITYEFEG